jgi:hypothetical protein
VQSLEREPFPVPPSYSGYNPLMRNLYDILFPDSSDKSEETFKTIA